MPDLGGKAPRNHARLSDLIKLLPEDCFGGGCEVVNNTRSVVFGNGVLTTEEGSGSSTPPLWRSGSPESSRRSYLALSPGSRTDAIARGQMELMEMVKNIPEGCYELSLKDLVEVSRGSGQVRLPEGTRKKGCGYPRRQQQHPNQQMVRGGSLDGNSGGFLLKMVFPAPWSARNTNKKKKKAIELDPNGGSNDRRSGKAVAVKEWWKMRGPPGKSSSLNSDSRKSSNRWSWSCISNSSNRRHEPDSD
ncbi:hypothetical protein SAY87_020776 [Trapa incisa]|uniref:Uncharacterized protein n=1 Tax=Trapa incisa TaxID=236973 RepID=A0AAN7JR67_9MYRT|nr:hypothetical protein SAY87_020776 [Trapa incisa]